MIALLSMLLICLSTLPAAADPATIGALIVGAELGSVVIAGPLTVGNVVGFLSLNGSTTSLASVLHRLGIQNRK
jgi:hypothetical protein